MRFVTYSDRAGRTLAGILGDDDKVRPFRSGITLDAFIALDESSRAAESDGLGDGVALADIQLQAPVRPKKNVFCIGRNYLAHAEEGARALGQELKLPDLPTIFTKAPTAIANPDQSLELDPGVSPHYDFEAEMGVVIGKRCRDVSEADALDVIFGYTCVNDVTARDLQRAHQQWFKGKSLDNTCPIGPWIVAAADIPDPQTLDIGMKINGVEKQSSNTAKMIFSVRAIINVLSRGLTLEPGDVIATGTPDGVGFARTPPEWLKDGDVMDLYVEKVGTLRNTIRLKKP